MSAVLESPVLALNRHYAPLRVLDAKRAVGMVFTGAAEVVDTEDAHFQTYDFASWRELSELKALVERDKQPVASPRVIDFAEQPDAVIAGCIPHRAVLQRLDDRQHRAER